MKTLEYWKARWEDAYNKRHFADAKICSLKIELKYRFKAKLRKIHPLNSDMLHLYSMGFSKLDRRRKLWLRDRLTRITKLATLCKLSAKHKRREEFAQLQMTNFTKCEC